MRLVRFTVFLSACLWGFSIPAADVVVEMHQDEIETELRYPRRGDRRGNPHGGLG